MATVSREGGHAPLLITHSNKLIPEINPLTTEEGEDELLSEGPVVSKFQFAEPTEGVLALSVAVNELQKT